MRRDARKTKLDVTVRHSTPMVSPGPQQARQGWSEALRAIPQAELDQDFDQLRDFRDAPQELDATGFTWPGGGADEKI